MRDKYFDFLCDIVDGEKSCEYTTLLGELHRMEYYPLIPNDDNRGEDGKQLRFDFMEEKGAHALSQSELDKPCSVLEMLVGLSYRLEFESAGSAWEKGPDEWFWILLDNLGIGWCDNKECDRMGVKEEIGSKVGRFLNRHYKSDGDGGLFPLKNPQKDQRRVEIWYQMSAYILENYPL